MSNTAIHCKCGGRDRLSCAAAAAVAALFFVAYPLFVIVGYVPTLVVAAICIYIGADFLWDNLVEAGLSNGVGPAVASWAVLTLCLVQDMLYGVVIGIVGFQLHARFFDHKKHAKNE